LTFDGGNLCPRPAIDAIDAGAPANPTMCTTTKRAFVLSRGATLYNFNPTSLVVTKVGKLACSTLEPFTMAVSNGVAYVLYQNGELFRVSLDTLNCVKTPLAPSRVGFPSNIGLATLPDSNLLAYGCLPSSQCGCDGALARTSDVTFYILNSPIAVKPSPQSGFPLDIKADAYGRLFACDAAGTLLMMDAKTGALLGRDETGVRAGSANALLVWNRDLFLFTQQQGRVHKYDLQTHQASLVATIGDEIVGAGATPCLD